MINDNLFETHPRVETAKLCGGQSLKLALLAARQWLEKHAAAVNALNVFPVPDGDTGTNMLLTMNAALAEIERSPDDSVSAIGHAVAHGALMGARGNSGVILSQIFRGFARSLDGQATLSAHGFAQAAQEACDTAYQGVVKPVEGTILTVAREAARAAREAAERTDDVTEVLAQVVETAKLTNALTPELLPVLKEAGVVDAGGQGLVYILEGTLRYIRGESVDADREMDAVVDLKSPLGAGEVGYGYDVQFLIKGDMLNVDEIRNTIDAMGESTLVVGDSHLVKVHVHVHDPGVPISYGVSQGAIADVIVENMEEQYKEFVMGQAKPSVATEELTDIATVCVVPGEGLRRVFESLGASAIIYGGQTMNPSTQELLTAVESVDAATVLMLPNNSNIILAANQARDLSNKHVVVVPTKTIPQGISAMLAFNYQADVETNAERMSQAAGEIQTIEVTQAVRSTQINGIDVTQGDIIGLLNDRLVAAGQDYTSVVLDVLSQASTEEYEIATIYFGQDATPEEANTLADHIVQKYPDLEVEVHQGGQAHYRHILSLE
ncbi:MAG: DAK2 domain-containing protein [Anaerolineales bacterium]|nr:MAG: DAK2 domain-containing protein [Anaerolineales bacterium]